MYLHRQRCSCSLACVFTGRHEVQSHAWAALPASSTVCVLRMKKYAVILWHSDDAQVAAVTAGSACGHAARTSVQFQTSRKIGTFGFSDKQGGKLYAYARLHRLMYTACVLSQKHIAL